MIRARAPRRDFVRADNIVTSERMQELGLGRRHDTYRFTDAEMHDALDRLLGDAELRGRLASAAATIQGRDGVRQAARLIEQTATTK
jgi:UDP:flavonoid glycosyltransferase YjiC (YdhE family)